jgi:hypothetical protein
VLNHEKSMSIQPIITIARAASMSGISIFTMRRLVRPGLCASVHVAELGRVRLSAVMSCRRELPLAKRTSPHLSDRPEPQ